MVQQPLCSVATKPLSGPGGANGIVGNNVFFLPDQSCAPPVPSAQQSQPRCDAATSWPSQGAVFVAVPIQPAFWPSDGVGGWVDGVRPIHDNACKGLCEQGVQLDLTESTVAVPPPACSGTSHCLIGVNVPVWHLECQPKQCFDTNGDMAGMTNVECASTTASESSDVCTDLGQDALEGQEELQDQQEPKNAHHKQQPGEQQLQYQQHQRQQGQLQEQWHQWQWQQEPQQPPQQRPLLQLQDQWQQQPQQQMQQQQHHHQQVQLLQQQRQDQLCYQRHQKFQASSLTIQSPEPNLVVAQVGPESMLHASPWEPCQEECSQSREGLSFVESADPLPAELNSVLQHVLTRRGSHIAQEVLDIADSAGKARVAEKLRGHVEEMWRSPHANHVLQKLIAVMAPEKLQFVVDELQGSMTEVARHQYGCRILQRLIEHCPFSQVEDLFREVIDDVPALCHDYFGNYVLQHLLEHGSPSQRQQIAAHLEADIFRLSKHQGSSNVVVCALSHCALEDKRKLVLALYKDKYHFASLRRSQAGSFVVRAATRAKRLLF